MDETRNKGFLHNINKEIGEQTRYATAKCKFRVDYSQIQFCAIPPLEEELRFSPILGPILASESCAESTIELAVKSSALTSPNI
jgi:hypothetical protein